jgi:hypothetical protein
MFWLRKVASLPLIIFLVLLTSIQGKAQEKNVREKVAQGFQYLYDFQFQKADSISQKTLSLYPQHPLAHLLRAHYFWYLIVSGLNNNVNQEKCKSALKSAEKLQENKKKSLLNNDELFTQISIEVLYARLESLNGNEWNSFTHLNKGTNSIKHSLGKENQYPYFLLVNGLYLYYRTYARSAYPYLAPYLVLMPSGNEAAGLQMLRTAAQSEDPFLSCEARYFLMKLCMAREWNKEAITLGASLYQDYPKNLLFGYYYAVLCKQNNQSKELTGIYQKMLLNDPASCGYLKGQKDYFLGKIRALMAERD